MSHEVQIVVKLLVLGCTRTDIYGAWTDIYGTRIDTHTTQTDTHATRMDTYDLMSDKYITHRYGNFSHIEMKLHVSSAKFRQI